jgi:hypothetical protein
MTGRDNALRARPGRTRNGGPGAGNPRTFAGEFKSAATEGRAYRQARRKVCRR